MAEIQRASSANIVVDKKLKAGEEFYAPVTDDTTNDSNPGSIRVGSDGLYVGGKRTADAEDVVPVFSDATSFKKIGDTSYNVLDVRTKQYVTYDKVTTYSDGTPMDDSKLDPVIYLKQGDEYIKRNTPNNTIDLRSFGLDSTSTDNSAALSWALNLYDAFDIIMPEGEFVVTTPLSVKAGLKTKRLIGTKDTVLRFNVSAGQRLLNLESNIEFHNIIFDYSNSYCWIGIDYKPNVGNIVLNNVKFRNAKDTDTTRASSILYLAAEGNFLNLSNLEFKNILKRGNGSITDGPGSINCILYGGNTSNLPSNGALGGYIDTVRFDNIHNINSSDSIITEDASSIYLALSGLRSNLMLRNIEGFGFGKRLLKIQASSTVCQNIYGYSDDGDALSVIGSLSEPSVFTTTDNKLSNVTSRGIMEYPIAITSSNTILDGIDIDNGYLAGAKTYYGIYFDEYADSLRIRNFNIKAQRPLGFVLLNKSLNDVGIDTGDLRLIEQSVAGIVLGGNPGNVNSVYGLNVKNLNVYTSSDKTNRQTVWSMPVTANPCLNYAFENISLITARELGEDASIKVDIGVIQNITNLSFKNIKLLPLSEDVESTGDGLSVYNSRYVSILDYQFNMKITRGLNIVTCSHVTIGRTDILRYDGTNNNIVVQSSSTDVSIDPYNERFAIVSNPAGQDPTEVVRGKGATSERPKNAPIGFNFFDTTLGRPITKIGATTWLDGDGRYLQLGGDIEGTRTAPTVKSATTTVSGKVELATDTETIAGTDTTRAVTPSGLKSATDTKANKVGTEDIEITDTTKGIILKSPSGTRWRLTVSDAGEPVFQSL